MSLRTTSPLQKQRYLSKVCFVYVFIATLMAIIFTIATSITTIMQSFPHYYNLPFNTWYRCISSLPTLSPTLSPTLACMLTLALQSYCPGLETSKDLHRWRMKLSPQLRATSVLGRRAGGPEGVSTAAVTAGQTGQDSSRRRF